MDAGPVRTCIGCRTKRPQHELIRIGRTSDGGVSVGFLGPGRGAYLCRKRVCIEAGLKNDRLRRALRSERLPEGLLHELMRKGTDGEAKGS